MARSTPQRTRQIFLLNRIHGRKYAEIAKVKVIFERLKEEDGIHLKLINMGAGFTIKPLNEDYIGVLRAIDPKTGKEVWASSTRHSGASPP